MRTIRWLLRLMVLVPTLVVFYIYGLFMWAFEDNSSAKDEDPLSWPGWRW